MQMERLIQLIARDIIVPAIHIPGAPHECCATWFLADGRFILHPRCANVAAAPPTFALPSTAQIVRRLAGRRLLRKYDLRGWFLQIQLPPHLRQYFQFEAIDGGGRVSRWALSRVPMGFSGSPVLADFITRMLAGVDGGEDWEGCGDVVVYLDDVLALTEEVAAAFERRCAEWGAEIKSKEVAESLVYVGIEICASGRFRPSPRLAAKLLSALAAARLRGLGPEEGKRVAGLAIAFLERAGEVLAKAGPLIRLAARGEVVPAGEVYRRPALEACFTVLENLAGERVWRRAVRPGRVAYGASDASLEGFGFVWRCDGEEWWGKGAFSSRCGLHVNLLELVAVKKAIEAAPEGAELRLWVDNMCTLEWLRRGVPRVRMAAQVIIEIDGILRRRGQVLYVAYVDSANNPADGLSRGAEEPGDLGGLVWAPVQARRVLGWAVPCDVQVEKGSVGEEEGGHEGTETASGGESEEWEDAITYSVAAESLGLDAAAWGGVGARYMPP